MADEGALARYARRLYERRYNAVIVDRVPATIQNWSPSKNDCHINVTTWCANHQSHKPVRGWMYFDFLGLMRYVYFNAHSVIENEHGELADITPLEASQPYPFIRAEEDDAAYRRLIRTHNLIRLTYYPATGLADVN